VDSRVQCSKISFAFGDRDLLKEVTLLLATGSHAALAGVNGSGKTTLMKIAAGLVKADCGEVTASKDCRVSYLPQTPGAYLSGRTLWEEAETAFARIQELLVSMDVLGEKLKTARESASLVEAYHKLQEAVEASGYYERDAAIGRVLDGLGFSAADYRKGAAEFSGGWQMRIALAKVLLENPDIMLLDEPTNYLDIEARTWLEAYLASFKGGYLLVSHDRYFLDTLVNEVYELFQGRCRRYAGNYSAYEKTRQTEMASLLKQYAEQEEEIAKSEELIRRFRYKASKAAMVQERIKKIEKIKENRIETPPSLKKISIRFPPPPHSGRTAVKLEGVGKSYGTKRVLENLNLLLDSGERLVVAGKNGAGKSTLLRIIAGADTDFSGSVSFGAGISGAYFSQDNAERLFLNGAASVLEFIENRAPDSLVPKLRDMLGAFLFPGDDVYKSVSVLSGGEKIRLALLCLLLKGANLLILDEPTNHLDLHSKDILLDALNAFSGTIVFVSHDRAFMESLSTKTLELSSESGARLFYGGYGYYLEHARVQEREIPKTPEKNEDRRVSKERQAQLRRLKKNEQQLLEELEALETEYKRLEQLLSQSGVYRDAVKARETKAALDKTKIAIDTKSGEWEQTARLLEEG
jgi:ATP-binding cassette subfamily F protein 3